VARRRGGEVEVTGRRGGIDVLIRSAAVMKADVELKIGP
jgi:hypothetical protein